MRSEASVPATVRSKLIEIVGAGLASAVGAFLLGQIAKPTAPPPPVVKIMPAAAETIRMLRGDAAPEGPLSAATTETRRWQRMPYHQLPTNRFEQNAM